MVFGLGSGEEEEADITRGRSGSPVEEVRRLASRGFSEKEIINELKDKGYSNTQINRALNKVLKFRVSSSEGEAGGRAPPRGQGEREAGEGDVEDRFIAPPPEEGGKEAEPAPSPFEKFEGAGGGEEVWEMSEEEEIELEELIEEIIDERWADVESRLSDFEQRNEKLRNEIDEMKEKIQKLEEKHEEEKEKLEDKVDRTFSHIESIESRVGSVEKAFKEFLPSLTENVRSLSSIVKDLRKETGTGSTTRPSSSTPSPEVPSSPEDYLEGPSQGSEVKKESNKGKGPSALEE